MKKNILEVTDKGEVIAKLVPESAWEENLGFYSDDSDFLQVGTWRYDKGKLLARHIHNKVERTINRTHEVLYVVSGSVKAQIYNLNEELVRELTVNRGDFLILLNSGHGYEILEDGTKVLEIKNGPYAGAEKDRRRF
jgi:quercetin dioxygenase-like cupin family protein